MYDLLHSNYMSTPSITYYSKSIIHFVTFSFKLLWLLLCHMTYAKMVSIPCPTTVVFIMCEVVKLHITFN